MTKKKANTQRSLTPAPICSLLIQAPPEYFMKYPAVYIMASQRNGTLYVGVTSHLVQRVWQHSENLVDGFTRRYDVKMLVWYEQHQRMETAISREKAIKKWRRDWKLRLIEKHNPSWRDLWPDIATP